MEIPVSPAVTLVVRHERVAQRREQRGSREQACTSVSAGAQRAQDGQRNEQRRCPGEQLGQVHRPDEQQIERRGGERILAHDVQPGEQTHPGFHRGGHLSAVPHPTADQDDHAGNVPRCQPRQVRDAARPPRDGNDEGQREQRVRKGIVQSESQGAHRAGEHQAFLQHQHREEQGGGEVRGHRVERDRIHRECG